MTPRGRLVTLVLADIISNLGSRISLIAIPWLVLETTGSPTRMGIVAAAETLPYMLSSALAAPWADRIGLRRTSVLADAGSAVVMAAIALTPQLGFGALVVLVAVAGGLRGIGDRVKHVMLRPAAEAAGVKLIRLTSVYDGLSRGAVLLGAGLGGLLVYWFGSVGAIWIDAGTFVVCAALVGLLVRVPGSAAAGADTPREGYFTALRGGFRYLRQDRILLTMLVVVSALNMVANASVAVFIPLWVDDVLHNPAGLGLLLATFSAGALVGNGIFAWLGPRLPRYLTFVLGAAIAGTPRLLAMALSDGLVLVTAVTFVSAIGVAAVNPLLGVALYERVPDELQTRVIGISGAVAFIGLPVGALFGGWTADAFGLSPALLIAAAVCLLVTALPVIGARRELLHPTPG